MSSKKLKIILSTIIISISILVYISIGIVTKLFAEEKVYTSNTIVDYTQVKPEWDEEEYFEIGGYNNLLSDKRLPTNINSLSQSVMEEWTGSVRDESNLWIPAVDTVYCIGRGTPITWISKGLLSSAYGGSGGGTEGNVGEGDGESSDGESSDGESSEGESSEGDGTTGYIPEMHMLYQTMATTYNKSGTISCGSCEGCNKTEDEYLSVFYNDGVPYPGSSRLSDPVFSIASRGDLTPLEAYIVSKANDTSGNKNWSWDIQNEIWGLQQSGLDYNMPLQNDKDAGAVEADSIAYAEYHEEIKEIIPGVKDYEGLNPKVLSKMDDIEIIGSYTDQVYTIKNVKIDYIEGTGGEYAFSGIEDIFLNGYGYDSEDNLILKEEDIMIKEIIVYDGYGRTEVIKQEDIRYFTPTTYNPEDLGVDTYSALNYPKPNQTFDIVIDNPNKDKKPEDYLTYFTIQVDFQYMLAEDGTYIAYNTSLKQLTCPCSCPHSTNACELGKKAVYYNGVFSHYKYTHWDCNWGYKISTISGQQPVVSAAAIRRIYKQSLIIGKGWEGDDIDIPEEYDFEKFEFTMNLGGFVWEDVPTDKEEEANGMFMSDDGDILLENIKVTLYEEGGNLAEINKIYREKIDAAEGLTVYNFINSTLTNEKGEYFFVGIDPMKKYYVVFEYNGQIYIPTIFEQGDWEVNSNALEFENGYNNGENNSEGRTQYDDRYTEIGSAPENYITTESFGISSNGQNQSFTQLELMGYRLNSEGEYEYIESLQIVDGFLYEQNDEIGIYQTEEFSQGLVTDNLKTFIESFERYPTDDEMAMYVYGPILASAENKDEMYRMIQFIEDRNIDSLTVKAVGDTQPKLYPVDDKFVINTSYEYWFYQETGAFTGEFELVEHLKEEYNPLYPKQLGINLGLWRRQEFDAALVKDLYRVAVKINEKTVVYEYDARTYETEHVDKDGNPIEVFDIHLRLSDYSYYSDYYERELFYTDYVYKTDTDENNENYIYEFDLDDLDPDSDEYRDAVLELLENESKIDYDGEDLEVYATYKIRVKNQSQTIEAKITEIVDYYDSEYTYRDDLSWIVYGEYDEDQMDESYYEVMENALDEEEDKVLMLEYWETDAELLEASGSEETIHTSETVVELDETRKAIYVTGQKDIQLEKGDEVEIYLTFQVNKDKDTGLVILDEENVQQEYDVQQDEFKYNFAEINGFITYYRQETELPNIGDVSGQEAGLLDIDSTPGTLTNDEMNDIIENEKYENFFQDDTDRAIALNLKLYGNGFTTRELYGYVFEDERTENVEDAIIGDGIFDEEELGIAGARVQLVELIFDEDGNLDEENSEHIWQQVETDENGYYEFKDYLPGDYIVRYYYGHSEDMIMGEVSYNGHDFKSTTYQYGIEQSEIGVEDDEGNLKTDLDGRFDAYLDVEEQNEKGTFGYSIYDMDLYMEEEELNVSDAKDLWSFRQDVIDYSDGSYDVNETGDTDAITNEKSEILASHDIFETFDKTFRKNTFMIAESGILAVEVEYDRQESDGSIENENTEDNSSKDYYSGENSLNGNYVLANIDLGLTERPKAQLEIDKEVTNVKLTLANQSILFDVVEAEAVTNVVWLGHKPYDSYLMKTDEKFDEYYGESDRYALRPDVDTLVKGTDNGLIQLTMDEELMHGSTIEITYAMKVTNVGEVDYEEIEFYYTGENGQTIVETKADFVVDYVANNLKYDNSIDVNNENWTVISTGDLDINADAKSSVEELNLNVILETEALNKTLVPGDSSDTIGLVLSQLITAENDSDDLTYENVVEIVSTSNTAGRRMAYSIVGNHEPYSDNDDTLELDTSYSEKVIIIPPFGEYQLQDEMLIFVVAILVGLTLAGGIVFIKKKVIGKTEE